MNNFNGTGIRLLYSATSGILCLHMFSMSPYIGLSMPATSAGTCGTQSMATFAKMDPAKAKYISQTMFRRASDRNNNNNHSDEGLLTEKDHQADKETASP